jgi:hypothetical protein
MGLFAKKTTAEQFGAALRMAYVDMYRDALSKLRAQASSGLTWPDNLENEVGALVYFAFDLGMSSGSETTLRNRIRDGFLAASPPPPEVARTLEERCSEYSDAMRSGDRQKGTLALGEVFAKHTGHEADVFVGMRAVAIFQASYNLASEQVGKAMRTLK